ncbi:thiolase family protein [Lactobacillus sp. YT155]|uniref:thiolase family protein n=1 Tax=Lactobacillus sp. YT155 TaxID=3060955 RepID=UPI0026605906|nr:thiolase family protein [Lactobacillus sp. YT155]MDO1605195.1 thiolase family protein [Lactobacillus sp. YT155]
MESVVILDAKRTPIGKFFGGLSDLSSVEIATKLLQKMLQQNGVAADDISQVILGSVYQAGNGQNVARQVALNSGLSQSSTAMTINQVCGSGLKAIHLAQLALQADEAKIIVAGGVESMSSTPFLNQRTNKLEHDESNIDSLFNDGLNDAFNHQAMGVTAENVAEKYHISRKEQDEFAYNSQIKASQADFSKEIIAINDLETDESIRGNTTIEKLGTLPTSFKENGTVTPGNSSPINDGASLLLLTTKKYAEENNLNYLAEINNYVEYGNDPDYMGYAPYYAISELMKKENSQIDDYDLLEINEAFAAQAVAVAKDLQIDSNKLNIKGGALALGHPLGASGARIVTTLIHNLQETKQTTGIASLCIGGGMGMAMSLKLH